MAPSVLAAAIFWTFAYAVIVGGLAAVARRVREGPDGAAFLRDAAPVAALALFSAALLAVGPRLMARLGQAPVPARLAWNGACGIWILFEWSLLVRLLELVDAASSRFLGRRTFRIPAAVHAAGALLIVAAVVGYHRVLLDATAAAPELSRGLHFFVRICGFAYILLEAAIAFALWRARRVLGSLLALA